MGSPGFKTGFLITSHHQQFLYYLKNHKFPNDVKLVEQNPYYGSLSLPGKGKVYFVILKYVPSK
jgi:hypothetical protein